MQPTATDFEQAIESVRWPDDHVVKWGALIEVFRTAYKLAADHGETDSVEVLVRELRFVRANCNYAVIREALRGIADRLEALGKDQK